MVFTVNILSNPASASDPWAGTAMWPDLPTLLDRQTKGDPARDAQLAKAARFV
jgi:hypothetical protein